MTMLQAVDISTTPKHSAKQANDFLNKNNIISLLFVNIE